MGGGCSSQRAVHVTDKDTRIQLRKKLIDDGEDDSDHQLETPSLAGKSLSSFLSTFKSRVKSNRSYNETRPC